MSPAPTLAPSPTDLRLSVIRAADGDPALADALRRILWDDYCAAGRPYGPDEEGLWMWCAHGQGVTAQ